MQNHDIEATTAYHDATKHSYRSIRTGAHVLDWENQPLPYKIYPDLDPIPLPRDVSPSGASALRAVRGDLPLSQGEVIPDLPTLAEILRLSAGITKRLGRPGGEIGFRAAACTGALYHIDLYLVSGNLPNLGEGVYHFGPHDFSLRRLRHGDYRGVLMRAMGEGAHAVSAPAALVLTSTFWRNSWKYQARTYRHCFWDSGTILANLFAAAAARAIPLSLVCGFVDQDVNALLGIDTDREVSLALVSLGRASSKPPEPPGSLEQLRFRTVPLSKREVDEPLILSMHTASCLRSPDEVKAWRSCAIPTTFPEPQGRTFSLPGRVAGENSIEDVIVRRGSARRFARDAITLAQLATLLDCAFQGIPSDCLGQNGALNHVYLVVHAVEGLPPGAYVYHRNLSLLELLREGGFRKEASYLGLEQELAADASVALFFLTDLEPVLERFGNRGYRVAELEAGILGGRLYLASYALGLGATGLTFYDDDVTEFFSPHAAGKSAMFLIALGVPAKRSLRIRR
jgi:SagB-type dehydrogenase family enzyme